MDFARSNGPANRAASECVLAPAELDAVKDGCEPSCGDDANVLRVVGLRVADPGQGIGAGRDDGLTEVDDQGLLVPRVHKDLIAFTQG